MLPNGWRVQSVLELGRHDPNTVQTGPFGSQLHAEDYVEEGIPLLLIRNIGENGLILDGLPRISEQDAARLARYALKPGDVVFSRVGRVGSCFLATEAQDGWIISGQTLRIRLPYDGLNPQYFLYALRDKEAQDFITGASVGTTRSSINTSILKSLPVRVPSYPEQIAIADILTTVDRVIEQTEALIAKQRRIKAGLLHDLLTRGIDEHGHLRDPSTHRFKPSSVGLVPEEWEVVPLGSLSAGVTSGSRGWARYYSVEGAKFIRIGNLTRQHVNLILDDVQHVHPPLGSEGKRTSLEVGDLLISITADLGIIGVVPEGIGEAYINQHIALVKLDQGKVNPWWIGNFLAGHTAQRLFSALNESGAKAGLNLPTVASFPVPVPDMREQIKITQLLRQVDTEVVHQEAQLLKLRSLRTGLMQDLLSGRVSVAGLAKKETHLTSVV